MNALTNDSVRTVTRQPAFHISESEEGAKVSIALPGVRKEAIKLQLKEAVLQVEATRENTVPEDWKNHSAFAGKVNFELNVRLTRKLDGENIQATFENGVLTLNIPVREDAKPREILVN